MVTYNCDKRLYSSISSVINQVDKLIIVDNGSKSAALDIIKDICINNSKIKLIEMLENKGIAYALNRGIEYSLKDSYDWILTLDQDSICTEDMILKMLDTYDKLSENIKNQVYVLTPNHVEEKKYRPLEYTNVSNLWEYKLTQITSGTLTKIEVYKKFLYNEDLFIDLVDHDFCLSISEYGMKIIQVNTAILKHNLGESFTKNVCGIKVTPTNHTALRRYYMTRNRLFIWKKFFLKYPKWVICDIRRFLSEIIKICFFESNKKEKIKMIFIGFKDYKCKKMGKYNH